MIVLDTNVVSALMQASPPAGLIRWLDGIPADRVWTTAITVLEVRAGIALLGEGRRRQGLAQRFEAVLDADLGGRVLAFDRVAAERCAELVAERQRAGRPMELRDAQIGGIVLARGATLATRNVRHFEGSGIAWVDPFSE